MGRPPFAPRTMSTSTWSATPAAASSMRLKNSWTTSRYGCMRQTASCSTGRTLRYSAAVTTARDGTIDPTMTVNDHPTKSLHDFARTPADVHTVVDATGIDAGVPWHYGDPFAEQRILDASAGLVDRTNRGVLIVPG